MPEDPRAPPAYVLDVIALDIPEHVAVDARAAYVDQPRATFVDDARAAALALPVSLPPTPTRPAPIPIVIDAVQYKLTHDGYIELADGGRQELRAFCADAYALFGWEVLTTVTDQIAMADGEYRPESSERSQLVRDLLSIVRSLMAELARRIADFLVTFEQSLLADLSAALTESARECLEARKRYLDPTAPAGNEKLKQDETGKLVADAAQLREHIADLLGLRQALAEHEQLFQPLSLLAGAGRTLNKPLLLSLLDKVPDPTDLERAFGPLLGPQLARWFGSEIRDYVMGRNALLRAIAQKLASAGRRHAIIEVLWRRFTEPPSEEELAREIASVCAQVEQSVADARAMQATGAFAALLREVVVGQQPRNNDLSYLRGEGSRHGPQFDPVEESIVELTDFGNQPRPDQQLGDWLARRATLVGRFDDIVGKLPAVTVWDLDALVGATSARMREQGRLGLIEATVLRTVAVHMGSVPLGDVALEIGGSIAIGLAVTAAGAPVAAAGIAALSGVLCALYEAERYAALKVLAGADTLSALSATRRILSRDPSVLALAASLIGVLGDAAAIIKLGTVIKFLAGQQVLFGVLAAVDASEGEAGGAAAVEAAIEMALGAP